MVLRGKEVVEVIGSVLVEVEVSVRVVGKGFNPVIDVSLKFSVGTSGSSVVGVLYSVVVKGGSRAFVAIEGVGLVVVDT